MNCCGRIFDPAYTVAEGSPETTTVEARNPRFTKSENEALARKVSENYSKLFGHLSTKTSKHEKKEIWKKIARYVSARGTNRRAPDKCKKRFSDLKLKVKNKMAKEKQRRWPTGCRRRVKVTYNASENIIRQLIDAAAVHGVTNAAESISQGLEDQEHPNTEKRKLETPNIFLETTNVEQKGASLAVVPTDVSSIEREAENTNVTTERRSETTQTRPIHDEYISGVHSLPGQHQKCNVGVLDNEGVCTQLGSLSQVVNELKDQIQTTNQILSQLSQNLANINDTLLKRNTQSQQVHSTNAYPNVPHPQTLANPHPHSQHGLQRVCNEFADIQSHTQPTKPTGQDFLNQPQVAFSSSDNLDLNTSIPTGQTRPSTKVLPSVVPPLEQRVSVSHTTPELDSAESQSSSSDKDED